ncbi:MAG TPA: PKD domain-containing protein [Candidatus Binatia bacterium]|nr:PKD domain-containing protein [Candidatus Binatia bacterium]
MKKWLLGILAGGLVLLLAWLFLPALPFLRRGPVAQIHVEPQRGAAPLTVLLASAGANSDLKDLQFEWTVDGAVVSDRYYFYHKLTAPGRHTITLKVTDPKGVSNTDTVTVDVAQRAMPPLAWSTAGPVGGMDYCVQVNEPADPAPWGDNYLCSSQDFGLKWSSAGPIAGMRCTQITEPEEPAEHGWGDNYLCVPESSPLELEWSNKGPIAGKKCLKIGEAADRHGGWKRNSLCYSLNSTAEAQKPAQ